MSIYEKYRLTKRRASDILILKMIIIIVFERGERVTKQRELILRLVKTNCAHKTADEIYRAAKCEMPAIGVATVYRNLALLSRENEIRRISVAGEPDRFDKTVADHEHAVCRVCGKTRDVEVNDIRKRIAEGLNTNDFTYDLSIHDLCPECRKNNSSRENK